MMEDKENTTPPIKCGYCGWFIGGLLNTGLRQHKCFQSYDEHTQYLHINDSNIATIVKKHQSVPVCNDQDDYNECLISAVQARPALYDHRIPVKERSTLKKKALWKEVLNLLGETENNLEAVQKRWKQLRDCYVKAKRKETEYIPSGSAAPKIPKIGFNLYNQMKFLDDVSGKSSTITSLPNTTNTNDQYEHADILEVPIEEPLQVAIPESNISIGSGQSWAGSDASPSPSLQRKTKKSKPCDNLNIQKVLISALEDGSAKKVDAVDGFLIQIGERLRALPPRVRTQFEIKILSQLFDLEPELSNHDYASLE